VSHDASLHFSFFALQICCPPTIIGASLDVTFLQHFEINLLRLFDLLKFFYTFSFMFTDKTKTLQRKLHTFRNKCLLRVVQQDSPATCVTHFFQAMFANACVDH